MNYIIINEWQKYLWIASNFDGVSRVIPQAAFVSPRDYRYGNAVNVFRYTPQMAAFLDAEGISHFVEGF